MALEYKNLDEVTRKLMLEEIEYDIQRNTLFISPRLNDRGIKEYPNLLINAATSSNDVKLAYDLLNYKYLSDKEPRRKKDGTHSLVSVPYNANELIAEGEFNRFYIRALCLRVLNDNKGKLRVYRAKQVNSPRPESQAKIGQIISASTLLDDLRTNTGIDTVLEIIL
jgi:hypothetical protein